MPLAPEAIKLIQEFESCLRPVPGRPGMFRPYFCPAHVATVGWGCTRYPDGRRVTINDSEIDQDTADRYFASELREDEAKFDALNTAKLHPFMRGALVSFVYNCGSGAYRGSGLRRAVNAGRWDEVPRELRKWRMGGGRVLRGLERRRNAEAALFMRGVALARQGDFGDFDVPVLEQDLPAAANPPTNTPTAPRGFWRQIFGWFLGR